MVPLKVQSRAAVCYCCLLLILYNTFCAPHVGGVLIVPCLVLNPWSQTFFFLSS